MILVIGAGVAGLSAALAAAAEGVEVELVTPGSLDPADLGSAQGARAGGNTAMAQGGVAAAIGAGDTPEEHLSDTLAAGAGIVDRAAAEVLTTAGERAVRGLLAGGLPVDRDTGGLPLLGIEGAHGRPRIVHSGGDRTGAALHAFLADRGRAVAAAGRLTLTEYTRVEALSVAEGRVTGARLRSGANGVTVERRADAVVLATGGYAALFPRTTNHAGARGEGVLLAARAGALLADLEFVQFHPTVLPSGDLVSEAVRGAGAVLLDARGERFMLGTHPLAELAPRDVVSREIHRVIRDAPAGATAATLAAGTRRDEPEAAGRGPVWLDATGIERAGGAGTLARRFPGISAAVAASGLDWTRDPIPVAPAAHYTMGGVASDPYGRSSVPGLFVAGEVACTGVHGANRLASNSLLEGLVFGERAGRAAARLGAVPAPEWPLQQGSFGLSGDVPEVPLSSATDAPQHPAQGEQVAPADARSPVGEAITAELGIERDGEGLRCAARVFADAHTADAELASLICAAATAREESRGAHQRADFPNTDPTQAQRRGLRAVAPRAAGRKAAIPGQVAVA